MVFDAVYDKQMAFYYYFFQVKYGMMRLGISNG